MACRAQECTALSCRPDGRRQPRCWEPVPASALASRALHTGGAVSDQAAWWKSTCLLAAAGLGWAGLGFLASNPPPCLRSAGSCLISTGADSVQPAQLQLRTAQR